MSTESLGVVGWAILGVLPAVFWTMASVRRATRRWERQFVRRASVLLWAIVAVFLAALRALPEEHAGFVFLIYAASALVIVGLLAWRRSQLRQHYFPGSYLFTRRAPFGR
jgi:hypothetical protein